METYEGSVLLVDMFKKRLMYECMREQGVDGQIYGYDSLFYTRSTGDTGYKSEMK